MILPRSKVGLNPYIATVFSKMIITYNQYVMRGFILVNILLPKMQSSWYDKGLWSDIMQIGHTGLCTHALLPKTRSMWLLTPRDFGSKHLEKTKRFSITFIPDRNVIVYRRMN